MAAADPRRARARPAPLDYAALFKVAQRFSERPVKFGAISAQTLAKMLVNRHYATGARADPGSSPTSSTPSCARWRRRAAGSSRWRSRGTTSRRADGTAGRAICSSSPTRSTARSRASRRRSGCTPAGAIPNQQPLHWDAAVLRARAALPAPDQRRRHLAGVRVAPAAATCRCSAKYRTDKKIAIGVVSHTDGGGGAAAGGRRPDPPGARNAVPPERLILSTDCGFGREGSARRIAFYKSVAINLGRQHRPSRAEAARGADPGGGSALDVRRMRRPACRVRAVRLALASRPRDGGGAEDRSVVTLGTADAGRRLPVSRRCRGRGDQRAGSRARGAHAQHQGSIRERAAARSGRARSSASCRARSRTKR